MEKWEKCPHCGSPAQGGYIVNCENKNCGFASHTPTEEEKFDYDLITGKLRK